MACKDEAWPINGVSCQQFQYIGQGPEAVQVLSLEAPAARSLDLVCLRQSAFRGLCGVHSTCLGDRAAPLVEENRIVHDLNWEV